MHDTNIQGYEVSQDVIHSIYKDQPIYRDLLSDFVSCLDERLVRGQSAFESKSWTDLSKIMHQLRGAAATYGYPTLAEIAGRIELASSASVVEEAGIADSMGDVESTCRRIEAGMRDLA